MYEVVVTLKLSSRLQINFNLMAAPPPLLKSRARTQIETFASIIIIVSRRARARAKVHDMT